MAAPGCISTAITVGATNNSDAVADFSNSSAQVDLYAPGVSVYSAIPGGGYGYKSGTSMATPQVVGSIAMMKAANTGLTVAQEESFLGNSGPLITDSKSGLQRHRINVLQAMGQETITLTNDGVRDLRNPIPYDHKFATLTTNGYWSAVAIRPPAGSDYDLHVYDASNFTGLLASSTYGIGQVDFVAQDNNSGRRAYPDWTYPLVHRFGSSAGGRYQIEYANDVTTIGDAAYNISMGSSEIIEIRDSLEIAGVPTYYRAVPSNSGQDPELYLMQSTAGSTSTYVQGRPSAVASSSGNGPGAAESFAHTSPVTQFNGLVLINRAGSGNYTLYRDTSAPSGSVTINNGDATTTSQNVTLSLPASDAQTGMMDMRISVDGVFDTEAWVPYSTTGTAALPGGVGTKTVDVQFRNNAGMVTAASDTIDLVTPTKPAAPTITNTAPGPGSGQATVTFTPGADGGDPITGFSAQCLSTDGGTARSRAGSSSPLTVTLLTPGKSYHCRVRATNGVGTGPYSAYGNTVTLDPAAPAPPTVTNTTTPTGGSARVAFSPGAANGSPITNFAAQCVSTDGGVTRTDNGGASPIIVTNLTTGKNYHCRVRATNAIGTGGYSAYGATVLVQATAPNAPNVTGTTGGAGQATTNFTPGANGGSPVTDFSTQCVSTNGGTTRSNNGPSSPITVTALTAGKMYHCRVRATNATGTSPYSAYGPTVPVT